MTKRRLERAVDEVSNELLTGLTPGERLHYLLEAQAQDKDQWVDRLQETCPPEQARTFTAAKWLAVVWALEAVYELHTAALHVELLETKMQAVMVIDHYRDESPSDDRLEQAAKRAAARRDWIADLAIIYDSYRRFATEHLGVTLETWLALHQTGPQVVDDVADLLETRPHQPRDMEWLVEDIEFPSDELTDEDHEALVEAMYENLVARWHELVVTTDPW